MLDINLIDPRCLRAIRLDAYSLWVSSDLCLGDWVTQGYHCDKGWVACAVGTWAITPWTDAIRKVLILMARTYRRRGLDGPCPPIGHPAYVAACYAWVSRIWRYLPFALLPPRPALSASPHGLVPPRRISSGELPMSWHTSTLL